VIPDLAKWEDWAVMDKLFDLYKTANEKNSWVRVPVVNYLRACPLPKAKDLLKECEKIDPAAVKRANSFFPTAPAAPSAGKASQAELPQVPSIEPLGTQGATLASVRSSLGPPAPPADAGDNIASALNEGVQLAAAVRKTPAPTPNLWAVLGVPWGVGLVLMTVQWWVLRRRAK
jgi:hypothetical protein